MSNDQSAPYVIYSTQTGEIGEHRHLRAIDFTGVPLSPADLIPLPEGTTLSMLPQRLAVGLNVADQRTAVSSTRGWALAGLLPIGYTRTHLPSYEKTPETAPLPFFGYTAIAGWHGRLYAAAIRTDSPTHWLPSAYDHHRLERLVRERLTAEPENRILQQHAHCALDYHCPTASNIFLRRWEGAIAVSPGCNARCVGCISKQDEDNLVSPQDRLRFVPTMQEVVDVAVTHLEHAPDAILSFGQGCEGEPLLQARLIEQAILQIRERTASGTLNINTNASNPRSLKRIYDAGLDSLRASTISARRETYDAYYRPIGYTFDDVKQSLIVAREAGVYSSINLLCFPGLIDCEDEIEALVAFLRETGVRLVQLRNLNIDPEVLLPRIPKPHGKPLGIRMLIDTLRREVPEVAIGNFSRPVQRASAHAQADAAPR
ncbi:MAG: radical SAM protein [Ktedonobacterales bacterium]|jgi:pyruvate-formate lyase-activating enzyme|nr:MAG: radical SAM protein [Ktedonobacterales bacterium]